MKVFYDEGELRINFGVAGEFKLGEPRDIPDETAEILIKKGRLKKYEDPAVGANDYSPVRANNHSPRSKKED